MATLTANLSLSSTTTPSNRLSISANNSLTTANPAVDLAKISIGTGSDTTLLTTSEQSADTYIYIKNTDSTNFVDVKDGASTPNDIAELGAGEYLFLPLKAASGIKLQADTAACVVEYGYWTKG